MSHLTAPQKKDSGVQKADVTDEDVKEALLDIRRYLRLLVYAASVAIDDDLMNKEI